MVQSARDALEIKEGDEDVLLITTPMCLATMRTIIRQDTVAAAKRRQRFSDFSHFSLEFPVALMQFCF